MRSARTCVTAGAIAATLMCLLAGCGQAHDDHRGKGDAPVAGRSGDDSPASVTNFPDAFANIATKCVAGAPGYRAFITTRNAAPVVLPDPACK